MNDTIKLTQFSHGAGCGCKISPGILDRILAMNETFPDDERLLVGNSSRDDAAAYDLGSALVSTTDFFMPIVDDPFDFGRIASANAISDVYAMGATPILAIAILGWPIDALSPEIAQKVVEGSRAICREAGIALAGGHSIDSPEPIFGLAVNGTVAISQLKRNDTARPGDLLFLTKPLGVGILTTAEKKGILHEEHRGLAARQMVQLNKVGAKLGTLAGVHAMTDVTGFGLLGHLSEMCEGSGTGAVLAFDTIPVITDLAPYLRQRSIPGGTNRNWDSYGHKIAPLADDHRAVLCDPQTSGGLLIAVAPDARNEVAAVLRAEGLERFLQPIGHITTPHEDGFLVHVQE
jgi:selenide,water dikinase